MYCLVNFCCICFNNKAHLRDLFDSDDQNITFSLKLTSCVPEMCFKEFNDQRVVCTTCCEIIDEFYKFRQKCLRCKTTITDYISQLPKASTVSDAVNIYLTDIKKYIDVQKEFQNENIKNKTEQAEHIKNQISFRSIGSVKMEIEDSNCVEKRIDNSLSNHTSPNEIILTACKIKIENENQDVEEQFQNSFDKISEKCDSENDYIGIKSEENNEYPLYLNQDSVDPLIKLEEIKSYAVYNNIGEDQEFLKENDEDPLNIENEGMTDKDTNVFYKTIEEKRTSTLSSKTSGQVCGTDKNQKRKRTRRVSTHTGTTAHECRICEKKFILSSHLVAHMDIHNGEKPYQCNICKQTFTQSTSLIAHIRIHTGEKPHECNICEKKFNVSGSLIKHMRIHSGEKPYECSVCGKKFSDNAGLTRHMRIHTGEKPYECGVCNKKFSDSAGLNRHMRIHTGEKPYECNICMKRFNLSLTLNKHLRIHTREKPYQCDVCKQKFSQSGSLNSHMRMHSGLKPYECSVCNEKYTSSGSLNRHVKTHTRK